jgi:hypothetical protein
MVLNLNFIIKLFINIVIAFTTYTMGNGIPQCQNQVYNNVLYTTRNIIFQGNIDKYNVIVSMGLLRKQSHFSNSIFCSVDRNLGKSIEFDILSFLYNFKDIINLKIRDLIIKSFSFCKIFLVLIIFNFNSISYCSDGGFMDSSSGNNNNPEVIIVMIIVYSLFKIYKIYSTFYVPPRGREDFRFTPITRETRLDLNDEEPEGIRKIIDSIQEFIRICNKHPYILIYIWLFSIFTCILFYKFFYLKYYKKK